MSKWLIMSDKKCFWYSLLTLISHNGYTHTLHPLYYAIWATPILLSYVAPFVSYKLRTLWETQHYWGNAASFELLRTLLAMPHLLGNAAPFWLRRALLVTPHPKGRVADIITEKPVWNKPYLCHPTVLFYRPGGIDRKPILILACWYTSGWAESLLPCRLT